MAPFGTGVDRPLCLPETVTARAALPQVPYELATMDRDWLVHSPCMDVVKAVLSEFGHACPMMDGRRSGACPGQEELSDGYEQGDRVCLVLTLH